MKTVQSNTLESLHHVQAFLIEHADRLPGITTIGMRKKLDDAITELTTLAVGQAGSSVSAQSTTQRYRSLRQVLVRDHMAKIAFVAAAELPSTPEVAPLRMPKRKVSAANLSLAAHGMAETAGKYTDVMVAAGLPGDFVARLIAASDAMMEAVRERSSTVSKRSGATTGLVPKLQAARKIVRALDRFVRSELKDDPTLLRTWQSVQRVRRPGRSASGSAAPAIPGSSPVMTGTTAPTSTAPSAVAA